jgi:hypothetical protein
VTLPTDYVGTDDTEDVDHAGMHNAVNAAVNAIDAELGTNPSGASVTVAARLSALDSTVAGKEAAGTAATAVAAHEAALDPHSQYATDSALTSGLAGKADVTHAHATSDVTGLDTALAGKAASSHSHVAADVTDLGDAATLDVGTTAGTVAAGDHTHSGVYDPAGTAAALVDDLSGVSDAATARSNLGLGSAAVLSTSDIDERARDAVGSALVAGTGITITPNDGADTITVATSAVLPTLVDAKGDLLVGTAADTVARLGVGSNGQVLTADSAAGPGVKWATPAAGGSLDVRDEGTSLTSAATRLDFVGAGVTATEPSADQVAVQIDGLFPDLTSGGVAVQPMMFGNAVNAGVYERLYLIPFFVPASSARYLNNVSVYVDTAGASGVVRFGLFGPSDGFQVNRQADVGTVTASSTGTKTLTLSSGSRPQPATYGAVNFVAVCIQGNSAVKLRGATVAPTSQRVMVNGIRFPVTAAYYEDSVSGAFATESYAPFAGTLTPDVPQVLMTWGTAA